MLTRFLLPLVAVGLLVFAVVHVLDAIRPTRKPGPRSNRSHIPMPTPSPAPAWSRQRPRTSPSARPCRAWWSRCFAKVGMKLQPGTPLFRLDDRQLQADLDFRQAAVEAARAELTRLENQPRAEQLEMVQASLSEAEANMADQSDQLQRTKDLFERKVTTDRNWSPGSRPIACRGPATTGPRPSTTMQKAGAWEFDKAVAPRPPSSRPRPSCSKCRPKSSGWTFCSLVDGEVLQVNVRPGEFVGTPPSQALVVVGEIDMLHVRVDVDEFDIPRFAPAPPPGPAQGTDPSEQFTLRSSGSSRS